MHGFTHLVMKGCVSPRTLHSTEGAQGMRISWAIATSLSGSALEVETLALLKLKSSLLLVVIPCQFGVLGQSYQSFAVVFGR